MVCVTKKSIKVLFRNFFFFHSFFLVEVNALILVNKINRDVISNVLVTKPNSLLN